MIRAQRILAFTGLLVVAWLLHTLLCEWRYKVHKSSVRGSEILVVNAGTLAVPARTPPGTPTKTRTEQAVTGLFAQREPTSFAIVFGVITPLVLLAVDVYLVLGWRYQSRLQSGRCPKCGYDLKGNLADAAGKCPECGWRRGDG